MSNPAGWGLWYEAYRGRTRLRSNFRPLSLLQSPLLKGACVCESESEGEGERVIGRVCVRERQWKGERGRIVCEREKEGKGERGRESV